MSEEKQKIQSQTDTSILLRGTREWALHVTKGINLETGEGMQLQFNTFEEMESYWDMLDEAEAILNAI